MLLCTGFWNSPTYLPTYLSTCVSVPDYLGTVSLWVWFLCEEVFRLAVLDYFGRCVAVLFGE